MVENWLENLTEVKWGMDFSFNTHSYFQWNNHIGSFYTRCCQTDKPCGCLYFQLGLPVVLPQKRKRTLTLSKLSFTEMLQVHAHPLFWTRKWTVVFFNLIGGVYHWFLRYIINVQHMSSQSVTSENTGITYCHQYLSPQQDWYVSLLLTSGTIHHFRN